MRALSPKKLESSLLHLTATSRQQIWTLPTWSFSGTPHFSCAGWEESRRQSGGCEIFFRSIPTTPRRYRYSLSRANWPLGIIRRGSKFFHHPRHLTSDWYDLVHREAYVSTVMTALRRE